MLSPWMIEQIRRQRAQRDADKRVPLHIEPPPPPPPYEKPPKPEPTTPRGSFTL